MLNKVLWLDNDPGYIAPFVDALRQQGFEVRTVTALLEAEEQVNKYKYDLLVLDVMIPTKTHLEEKIYKPEDTDFGHQSGLVFYKRMKEKLNQDGTETLIMSVRLDKRIEDEFVVTGLQRDRFATKMSLMMIPEFLKKNNRDTWLKIL